MRQEIRYNYFRSINFIYGVQNRPELIIYFRVYLTFYKMSPGENITICDLKKPPHHDLLFSESSLIIMFIVAKSFLLFLSKCLFPLVITSPASHLLFLRFCYACILFSLTSVCCAPCAVIPPAICNCFRSATKNEKRNEDPDSHGPRLIIKSKRILRILSAFLCNNNRELEVQSHVSAKKGSFKRTERKSRLLKNILQS